MASAMIHICVAKRLNEKLKRNEKDFFLGSIAPDIAKQIGQTKHKSHFLKPELPKNVPDVQAFIEKYSFELNQDFCLGYLVHLYTDKYWFDGFLDQLVLDDCVRLLDGTYVHLNEKTILDILYGDYTNLNTQLLDLYDLDLSLFYEPVCIPNSKIEEIPIDQLQLLVDKMSIIIENSKEKKPMIFDITQIQNFIEEVSDKIYTKLLEQKIITK